MELTQESKENKDAKVPIDTECDTDEDQDEFVSAPTACFLERAGQVEREHYAAMRRLQLRREELYTKLVEKTVGALIDHSDEIISVVAECAKLRR